MIQETFETVYYFWQAEIRSKRNPANSWSGHWGVQEAKRSFDGTLLVQDVLDFIEKESRSRSDYPDGDYILKAFNRI